MNPNKDCAIIFPQVLSNMILDSLKVEHISHKQLICSKLSFNPTQLLDLVKSTSVFSSFWAEGGVHVQEGDGEVRKSRVSSHSALTH